MQPHGLAPEGIGRFQEFYAVFNWLLAVLTNWVA